MKLLPITSCYFIVKIEWNLSSVMDNTWYDDHYVEKYRRNEVAKETFLSKSWCLKLISI